MNKVRHPEKQKNQINPIKKKPAWIKSKLLNSKEFFLTKSIVNQQKLVTVCEEANCPNITECWSKRHATFMIMGDTCTRACAFCDVKTGRPEKLDPFEPKKIALAVKRLNLRHVVKNIAKNCDMFFVIGSRNSSNSVRLVEVAKKSGCENSQLIHSESSIPYDKIENCNTIGISSGASAPEILVENFINDLKKLNINDKLVENGIIIPNNSIFIKEKEIKDLLESLSTSLSQHNKINRIYVKSKVNKEEYLISDDTVIELIHSKLSLSRLTEAWIKSLFISSLNKNIKKTKVIFRTENNYKSQIIHSPGVMESNLILEEYINIFKNYSEKCLPLPPESTYKYVEAKIKSKNENKAFINRWIGNKTFSKGERDNIEMKLCFGNNKEPEFFL